MRQWARRLALTVTLGLAACGDGAGTADAGGVDGGADATSGDAARPCERLSDCDDGLYCNGEEACVDARCRPGTPPCGATEVCVEAESACVLPECEGALADRDGDRVRSPACGGSDCDDEDGNRYPGNAEVCDAEGHDEDCDPLTYGFRDADGDGETDMACCNGDVCGTDCDDTRPGVNSRVPEVCGNGLDDDCDGRVDEALLVDGYADADGDGWGDSTMPVTGMCPGTPGFATMGGDCDETDPTINPGATEACDEIDNDCDGTPDDGLPTMRCYRDADGDGYGVTSDSELRCACGSGWATLPGDCHDGDPRVHPGADWTVSTYCLPSSPICIAGGLGSSGDWNCDGTAERRYLGVIFFCAAGPSGTCTPSTVWEDGSVPDCGLGEWALICNADCSGDRRFIGQECR